MSKKSKRKFSDEVKRKAVESFISGHKSAAQIAAEVGISPSQVYQWKIQLQEKQVRGRVNELESAGWSESAARALHAKETEIEAYQKKLAEQTVIMDLLKKLPISVKCQLPKNVSGSEEIAFLSAQLKKLAKR